MTLKDRHGTDEAFVADIAGHYSDICCHKLVDLQCEPNTLTVSQGIAELSAKPGQQTKRAEDSVGCAFGGGKHGLDQK